MDSQPTFLILTYLKLMNYKAKFLFKKNAMYFSKACKPDNFELHISLKLSFTNIRGLRLSFDDCESFLESVLLTFLLCVRQT